MIWTFISFLLWVLVALCLTLIMALYLELVWACPRFEQDMESSRECFTHDLEGCT